MLKKHIFPLLSNYSKYFEDDVIIEIDLCEKCISKLYDKKLKNKKEE